MWWRLTSQKDLELSSRKDMRLKSQVPSERLPISFEKVRTSIELHPASQFGLGSGARTAQKSGGPALGIKLWKGGRKELGE